ncbi:MAG: hypothetical protein Q7S95_02430 [bacterium]|nr:hypothetical protein [bacterium]
MSQSNGLNALFESAATQGSLSQGALQAIQIHDIGADINAALGVSVDDVKASEVVLGTLLIDDSGSIMQARNEQHVRDGHNLFIDSLAATKQKNGILTMCRYLNGTVLYAYVPVIQAIRMDAANYRARGGTPLYRESLATLAAVVAKRQEFEDNGIICRTITGIFTDGGDSTGGRGVCASDVKMIVDDMLRAENHIVAGIGVSDGYTDFSAVFGDMGIRPEWVLTPGNSPSEIRKAFGLLSQSAVRVSQSGKTFSQQVMGGFGSP